MSEWTTPKPGEHRIQIGCGEVSVFHTADNSRAHVALIPTLWRTDGDVSPRHKAAILACDEAAAKRLALEHARDLLRAALAATEIALTTDDTE